MILRSIIAFAPLVALLVVFAVRKTYQFKSSAIVITVFPVAHIITHIALSSDRVTALATVGIQVLVTAIVFVLLLGSFGAKVSGESYALIVGVGWTFPFDLSNLLPFIVMMAVGTAITFRVAIVRMRKYQSLVNESPVSAKSLLTATTLDLGIATHSLPSGEHLPERDSFGPGVRTSLAPGMLIGAILAVVLTILMGF